MMYYTPTPQLEVLAYICDRICEKGPHPAKIKNRVSHTPLLYIDQRVYPESLTTFRLLLTEL